MLDDGANIKNAICRTSRRALRVFQEHSRSHKQNSGVTGEWKSADSTSSMLLSNNHDIYRHICIHILLTSFLLPLSFCFNARVYDTYRWFLSRSNKPTQAQTQYCSCTSMWYACASNFNQPQHLRGHAILSSAKSSSIVLVDFLCFRLLSASRQPHNLFTATYFTRRVLQELSEIRCAASTQSLNSYVTPTSYISRHVRFLF